MINTFRHTRILLLFMALLSLAVLAIGLRLNTPPNRLEFALLAVWLFPLALLLAILIHLVLSVTTRGLARHLLRAATFALLASPILFGPEGTWVPGDLVIAFVAAWLFKDPAHFLTFLGDLSEIFVKGPINWIAPLLVSITALCLSLHFQPNATNNEQHSKSQ